MVFRDIDVTGGGPFNVFFDFSNGSVLSVTDAKGKKREYYPTVESQGNTT